MTKTPNVKLCQWTANDRILRSDFNSDNAAIDAAIAKEISDRQSAVSTEASARQSADSAEASARQTAVNTINQTLSSHTTTIAKLGNCQVYSLSYTGDGGGSKTVTFPHKPMAVFVQQVELPCYEMRMLQGSKCCFCHGPMTEWPSNVSWSGKSVTWSKVVDDRYSYSVEYMCNTSGKAYRLIALLDAAQ